MFGINKKQSIIRLFSLVLLLFLFSCSQTDYTRFELALGTVCIVTLYDNEDNSIYNDIFSRIREIENLKSVNIPSSDISRINAAAGIEPVIVHEETFKVIERAIYFAQLSEGAFDPTVGPLVSLWGIGTEYQRVPSQEEIEKAITLINWRNIELDKEKTTVYLTKPGMALDLGAIAKGYAADEAANIAKKAGVKRAKIDLGGNIILTGKKEDSSPWRVGIQNPGKDRGAIFGILQVYEQTVVTSGIYERYFEENGKHYHHIFDPFTGYPSDNGLLSVTVVTDISMDADALSTAVFVLGYEKGMQLIDSLPGIGAVFVFEDKSVRVTAGVDFRLTDKAYTY